MRARRFCLLTTFYPPYHYGGDGVSVHRLAEALAERGHHVDVVHSLDAYRLQHSGEPEIAFAHHANVRRLPLETPHPRLSALAAHQLGRPAFYAPQLRRLFAQNRYDVIHFHNVSLLGAPGLLGLGQGLKLYTANEYWLVCPTHVLFAFEREACRERRCLACTLSHRRPPQAWRHTGALARGLAHVDCILAPSLFALEQHRAQGVARPLRHLPHFVPPAAPQDAAGARPAPAERPYFVYVGRLEKLKGVQDLLHVFRHDREADLLVAGTGTYEASLRAQAAGLDHVRFLGALHPAALGPLYRGALAALVPSLCYETFGLTLAESLAHGTPVVARRIGALAENLEQSGGGLGFTSLEECRQAMQALRTNPELRQRLGRTGQQAAARLWSVEAHLREYLGLVEARLGPAAVRPS